MKYFPSLEDQMWNRENVYALGYCHGLGISIGAGNRTLFPHDLTLDNFTEADIVGDASCTGEPDGKYDYVYASHVLEHCVDLVGTIREWLRIVKIGGYVVIICPDCRFTPRKDSLNVDPQHKWDLEYRDLREIAKMLSNCDIVNKNTEAHPNYSMLMVLRKTK